MAWQIFLWIGQAVTGSALAILAFIAVRSTAVGERFLNYRLEQKIVDLKHAHDEKIEGLRSDLAHFQDRGRRANELEFDALIKIWHAYSDAWLKTQQAIVDYVSFPDMSRLSEDDTKTFLETTELSDAQKEQVLAAADKNQMYSKIMRQRKVSSAGAAIYEGRLMLRTNGILIPAAVSRSLKDAFDKLSGAYVEQSMQFRTGRGAEFEKSMDVLDTTGDGMIATLEALLRATIRRD
jgi:hypothetical protein